MMGEPAGVTGGDVLALLASKPKWTSEELEGLLQQQKLHKTSLTAKMEEAEDVALRLSLEGERDLTEEMKGLNQLYSKLSIQLSKVAKEKLPNRFERPDFYKRFEKAEDLEKAYDYLTVLRHFMSTSEQIQANIESDLDMEGIELFQRLKMVEESYLRPAEYGHLTRFGSAINTYWEKKLTSKLVKDFDNLLKAFGWPMTLKTALTPTLEAQEKFHRIIVGLAKLSGLRSVDDGEDNLGSESFKPIIPMEIMLQPLKRRFRFHFMSDKPTSESSRPEWYFSQMKQWLCELLPFVKAHFEKVTVAEIGTSSIVQFVRGISDLLVGKVIAHLNEDSRDSVFVKILEESIHYENEIGLLVAENVSDDYLCNYLPAFVDTIFSRPSVLRRWITAERQACLEKLDDMFSSPSAWNKPLASGPPEIVDLFVAVIRSLTDRFAHLSEKNNRIRFLELLNDILEEFHVRCLQTWKSKTEFDDFLPKDVILDYVIADALYSVYLILQEWEDIPFFASMSNPSDENRNGEYGSDFENTENSIDRKYSREILDRSDSITKVDGCFSTTCSMYFCLAEEIQSNWCTKVIKRLRNEFQQYGKFKWQSLTQPIEEHLSENLLAPLQTLKDIGTAIQSSMDEKSVEKWMKSLAVKLDAVVMELVIFSNYFSRGAIDQIEFDFDTGIFPAFSDVGVNVKLFFGSLTSSFVILRLSIGEAMLLYETLMNGSFEAHEVALAELGISITQTDVIKILRKRSDLHL